MSDELQPPFSYSIYLIIIFMIPIVMLTIYFIIGRNKNRRNVGELPELKAINLNKLENVKQKYVKQLDMVKFKLNHEKMPTRIAYQNVSSIIRHFVYEVTNIKVQNYTLEDIRKINMPVLYNLVEEYYVPAFSEQSAGDITSSLEKTRKVIEEWN